MDNLRNCNQTYRDNLLKQFKKKRILKVDNSFLELERTKELKVREIKIKKRN